MWFSARSPCGNSINARASCALQAVAGLGPRRPRRAYEPRCALQAVAGPLCEPQGRPGAGAPRPEASDTKRPRRPRRAYKSVRTRCASAQAPDRFDVQCGQRLAAAGIDEAHHAHSFIAGAAGAGLGNRRFTCCTRRKTANATKMKLITVFRNSPELSVGAAAAFGAARVG